MLVRMTLRMPDGKYSLACLRRLLKSLSRGYGLRCIEIKEITDECVTPFACRDAELLRV